MTEIKQDITITYPGFINAEKTSVFVDHREIVARIVKNVLMILPESRVISVDSIIKQTKDYLAQNRFEEGFSKVFETESKSEYRLMRIVQIKYFHEYLLTMVKQVQPLYELNLSQHEFNNGITVDDDEGRKAFELSRPLTDKNIDDINDFVDLDALARNILNDFIIDSQFSLGEIPAFPF